VSAHCPHTEAPNGGICGPCFNGFLQAQVNREAENIRLREGRSRARAEALDEAVRVVEEDPEGGDPMFRTGRIADAIRALKEKP
jgi:hypothetical protein